MHVSHMKPFVAEQIQSRQTVKTSPADQDEVKAVNARPGGGNPWRGSRQHRPRPVRGPLSEEPAAGAAKTLSSHLTDIALSALGADGQPSASEKETAAPPEPSLADLLAKVAGPPA